MSTEDVTVAISAIDAMTAHGEAAAAATQQLGELVASLANGDCSVSIAELPTHAGILDAEPADELHVTAWLEDGAELTSFLIEVEIDGHAHPIKAAFVHVDERPFLASDSPAALRALAAHCAEAADRLEARHTPGEPPL